MRNNATFVDKEQIKNIKKILTYVKHVGFMVIYLQKKE